MPSSKKHTHTRSAPSEFQPQTPLRNEQENFSKSWETRKNSHYTIHAPNAFSIGCTFEEQ
eukprot:c13112_g1_i1 orf=244-423(+)